MKAGFWVMSLKVRLAIDCVREFSIDCLLHESLDASEVTNDAVEGGKRSFVEMKNSFLAASNHVANSASPMVWQVIPGSQFVDQAGVFLESARIGTNIFGIDGEVASRLEGKIHFDRFSQRLGYDLVVGVIN